MTKAAPTQSHLARAVTSILEGSGRRRAPTAARIAANEASAEIYRAMGHIHFELALSMRPPRVIRTLVQIKPQYAMGWFDLAVCLERSGIVGDAAQAFHNRARWRPATWIPPGTRRVPSAPGGSQERALFSFERCLELEPAHADALFGKAWPCSRSAT